MDVIRVLKSKKKSKLCLWTINTVHRTAEFITVEVVGDSYVVNVYCKDAVYNIRGFDERELYAYLTRGKFNGKFVMLKTKLPNYGLTEGHYIVTLDPKKWVDKKKAYYLRRIG